MEGVLEEKKRNLCRPRIATPCTPIPGRRIHHFIGILGMGSTNSYFRSKWSVDLRVSTEYNQNSSSKVTPSINRVLYHKRHSGHFGGAYV